MENKAIRDGISLSATRNRKSYTSTSSCTLRNYLAESRYAIVVQLSCAHTHT